MSSDDDIVLSVKDVSKCFEMYEKPVHRLYQTLCAGKKKFYKEFWALRDISFDVHRGECVGIIGRNGAGKSTLLQIITGTLAPTGGSVSLKGRVAALLELGSGFNPEFTGRENVYLNGSILGLTHEEIDARYQDIIAFADIGDFISQPVKTYSSGMMVRLAFAVNAFVDPDVLIVDEALAVGDVAFQVKCYQKMRSIIANKEKSIIFVTHDMGTVKNFCSRVYWLDGGRIRQVGRPIDIVEQYLAAMLGRDNAPKKLPAAMKAAENTGDGSAGGAFQLVDVNKSAICNGEGGARITGVGLFDSSGNLLQLSAQSCPVVLPFSFVMEKDAESLHCAFQVLDKQGVAVIGSSNSILEKSIGPVRAGEMKTVSFSFTFPELANNDYVVLLAVNEGDIDRNVRLQNIVNAYTFKFHSSSLLQRQFVLFKLTDCKVRLV